MLFYLFDSSEAPSPPMTHIPPVHTVQYTYSQREGGEES